MKSSLFNFLKRNRGILIKIFLEFLDKISINDVFRLINKNKMTILLFHGITDKNFTLYNRRYHTKSSLEREIKYMKKKNYKFITLTEWVKIVEKRKNIRNRYVTLTFDDGLKNVLDNAYPIMKKHGAKGCFYIISGIIGKNKLVWQDYIEVLLQNSKDTKYNFNFIGKELEYKLNSYENLRSAIGDIKSKLRTLNTFERIEHFKQFNIPNDITLLKNIPDEYITTNWEDINHVENKILEIGCHSATHTNLENLSSEEEFYNELYKSKLKIEKNIKSAVIHLCYPSGSYNDKVIRYAKKYGFLTGISVIDGMNSIITDLFQLRRIKMENDYLLFKYKVSGLYYFIKKKFERIYNLR